jgi:hypothetical protein
MTRTEDGEWGVSARHPGAICWAIAFGDTPADALRRMARHMVQYRKLHGIEWFEERRR